ncbi:MAG: putative 2-dehydropantoate 2-reductase [Planctomycetota bacterium]
MSHEVNESQSSLRYGIIGTGAVGGLYGGMLAKSGHDVHFLCRSDFDQVCSEGLRVDSIWGDFRLPGVQAYSRADQMPGCDVILVTTKSTSNPRLAELVRPLVTSSSVILNLQNGLNVEADLLDSLPAERILGGCCFLCCNKIAPAHVRHIDYGRIAFGLYRPASNEASISAASIGKRAFADMKESGIEVTWTDDLAATRWRKLMWNIPFNGLSVAIDASTDKIMQDVAAKRLAGEIIREVHAAAAYVGVAIDPQAIRQTMEHTETMVPYESSMRLDYRFKRPLEIKAIFGNPMQAVADQMGLPLPEARSRTEWPLPRVAMLHDQLCYLDASQRAAS